MKSLFTSVLSLVGYSYRLVISFNLMCTKARLLNFNKQQAPVKIFVNLRKIQGLAKLAPSISPTGLAAKPVIERFEQQILPFQKMPVSLILFLQKQEKTAFLAKVHTLALSSFSIFGLFTFLDFYKFVLINQVLSPRA